jgi:hypothetical protein
MARTRWVVLGLLAVGLILALTACMGQWFTQEQIATLIIGDPVAAGGKWQVLISVANMPHGGLASMAVEVDGMAYTVPLISNIVATGLNGFTVLASEFNDATGEGRFVIANPTSGSTGGTILKLTFDATGVVASADITFDKTHIDLGSHLNTLITPWDLGTLKAYYAK